MERLAHILAPLDQGTALQAADASLTHTIPMADAIIYATAQLNQARIVTMDKHFKDLPGVVFAG